MSRRRRFRARDVSTWTIARSSLLVCKWCSEPVTQGALVLIVGPSRLTCCRECALRFRGVTPPAVTQDAGGDVDHRLRQLPEHER